MMKRRRNWDDDIFIMILNNIGTNFSWLDRSLINASLEKKKALFDLRQTLLEVIESTWEESWFSKEVCFFTKKKGILPIRIVLIERSWGFTKKNPLLPNYRYFTKRLQLWQKIPSWRRHFFLDVFFITYFHGEKTGKPWMTKKTFFYQFFDTFSMRTDFFVKNNILILNDVDLIGHFVLFPQNNNLLNKRGQFLVKMGDFSKN